MTPSEMQAIIDGLYGDLHNLCMLATEPGGGPVHQEEVVDRDFIPTTERATDAEVDTIIEGV